MRLNNLEFNIINSPVRALIEDKIEFKELRSICPLEPGKKVLEIGCGNGTGAGLIRKHFSPGAVHAIDLDSRMVAIARERVKEPSFSFMQGDACRLPFRRASFDAVFDIGAIHHIPDWKRSIREISRVLKAGGWLAMEELSSDTFRGFPGRLYRRFTDHPYACMFTEEGLIACLRSSGFAIREIRRHNPLGLIRYVAISAQKDHSLKL